MFVSSKRRDTQFGLSNALHVTTQFVFGAAIVLARRHDGRVADARRLPARARCDFVAALPDFVLDERLDSVQNGERNARNLKAAPLFLACCKRARARAPSPRP